MIVFKDTSTCRFLEGKSHVSPEEDFSDYKIMNYFTLKEVVFFLD